MEIKTAGLELSYLNKQLVASFPEKIFEEWVAPLLEKPVPMIIVSGRENLRIDEQRSEWGLAGVAEELTLDQPGRRAVAFTLPRDTPSWVAGYQTMLAVNRVLELASIEEAEDGCRQFFSIISVSGSPRGCGLIAYLTEGFVAKLETLAQSLDRGKLPTVREALIESMETMADKSLKRFHDDFQAGLAADGRFSLICTGQACDFSVYPDGMGESMWIANCHNVDNPAQALCLLCGFAALNDFVRAT